MLVGEALAIALQAQDFDAQTTLAVNLQRALNLCWGDETFDLIVLSADLPGMANFSGLLSIRDAAPLSQIVLLADQSDGSLNIRARELGAAAVLSYQAGWDELIAAIKHFGGAKSCLGGPTDQADRPALGLLTRRERDVLDRLVRGQSNKEIGRDLAMAPMTVAMHLTSIFRKLGVSNRLQAVATALRRNGPPERQ